MYLGVGPEQNFTYIAALRPKLAFIVDIRRGNLHEHLLYKAFIEMSADRVEFLSRLFARKRPADLPPSPDIQQLMAAYQHEEASAELFDRNLQAARDWLVKRHSFALSDDDLSGLEYVYKAFYEGGPDLNYSFPNGGFFRGGNFPTYADLMSETDGRGEHRGYLASEDRYRALGEIEKNNAIVPVVGNFAGPKALRAITTQRSPRSIRPMSRCISSSRRTTGRSSTATSPLCPSPKRVPSSARCRTAVYGSSFETVRPAPGRRRASIQSPIWSARIRRAESTAITT